MNRFEEALKALVRYLESEGDEEADGGISTLRPLRLTDEEWITFHKLAEKTKQGLVGDVVWPGTACAPLIMIGYFMKEME